MTISPFTLHIKHFTLNKSCSIIWFHPICFECFFIFWELSGGIAYVLDEHNDLYTRLNKSLISIEELTNKYDVQELKEMITEHAKTTGSAKGKYILEHFSEYLPKFKKIIPNDYKRMLNAIVQMEEKGLSSEQAQIEAFYANAGRK